MRTFLYFSPDIGKFRYDFRVNHWTPYGTVNTQRIEKMLWKFLATLPVFSPVPIPGTSEPSENSRVVDVTSCISDVNPDIQILLCTALIQVRDIWGNYQTCRCLLDSGSRASFITNECIERLGLRKEKANVRKSCLGASDTCTNGIAEIQFTPHFSSQNSFHASVCVINKIVGMIPHHDLDSSMRKLFGDISLADPAFYKSSPIDVLLGVDLTLPLLRGQTLSLGKDKPFAIRSELGWIIGGKANSSGQNSVQVNHIQLVSDQLINKFWELDSMPCAKPLTSLEEGCEDHFVKTHSRDENGRYTVRLPFHTPPTWLGDSKQNAIRRLVSVERHLISNPDTLANIPEKLKAVDSKNTIKDDQPIKILGIAWLPDVDKFTFTITINETDVWTKRKRPLPWSDSKITLAWLKSEPIRWQPFVANQVAQIQEQTPNVHWNFVSGLENPADCGTRGIPPTKLEKCDLWFNGPDWLRSSTFPIGEFEDNPQLQEDMSTEAKRTSKLIMLTVVDATFKVEFFQNFLSCNKLKRVVAYCLRFVKNCSLAACKRRKSFLTTAELSEAEKAIVKFIQHDHFSMEVSYLSADKQLPSSNKLIPLTPFYDEFGIIVVGGRLKNSILP
ncbi:integrase catalytic domain-containing protein [Trichonephila clavata]|uniref:Integrase catalytic domain-containing protein n=1 Tax=Trichonephila clavata TaxID=2740835 RepID=A0A8X6HHK9_TRICU|nr:integrase catalytic domain-containing protein [Trichonephila clavata]